MRGFLTLSTPSLPYSRWVNVALVCVYQNIRRSIKLKVLYVLNSLDVLRRYPDLCLTFDLSSCQTGARVQRRFDPTNLSVTWAV